MKEAIRFVAALSLAAILGFDAWVVNSVVKAGNLADENGTSGAFTPLEILGLATGLVATITYGLLARRAHSKLPTDE
jgi:hypothetical protein